MTVHVDDARSYLKKAPPGYDVIEFGYLDSQALFSSMSNVRLDGYVYTVESLRTAYGLLDDHGVLSLSFSAAAPFLGPKLFRMLSAATGRDPALYFKNELIVLIAAKDPARRLPGSALGYNRVLFDYPARLDLATDDWPYLYLERKTIPSDYLIAIASLLVFSLGSVVALRGSSLGREDLHFAFLGMGFLLLETKAIGDCTLFFGATWLVTLVVVTGVLLMVIAANAVAQRVRGFSFWMYVPLVAALLVLLLVPREFVLGLDRGWRLLWALVAVPLPVFFAGIIFSTTFRLAASPAAAFGANLFGAMVGGFAEYLTMALGNHRLSLLLLFVYLGSALVLLGRRAAIATPAVGYT